MLVTVVFLLMSAIPWWLTMVERYCDSLKASCVDLLVYWLICGIHVLVTMCTIVPHFSEYCCDFYNVG